MANFINKYLNQSAYDADSTKQYPNTSLVGTDIVFQMDEPAPPEINDYDVMLTISVPSNNTGYKLWGSVLYPDDGEGSGEYEELMNPSSLLEYINVDGYEISLSSLYSADNIYTFTQGTHTIKYKALRVEDSISFVDGSYCICDNNMTVTYLETKQSIETFGESTRGNGTTAVDLYSINVSGNVVFDNVYYMLPIISDDEESMDAPVNCTGNLTLKNTDRVCEQDGVYPTYTNLYVPSSLVSSYESNGWENVNAIQN